METAAGFRVFCQTRRIAACLVFVFLALTIRSNGQQSPASPSAGTAQAGTADSGFTIRIGVEEVRLDAVVLDEKGRQITDLTAEDFEIYQDHFGQKITSCVYINDYQPRLDTTVAAPKGTRGPPSVPVPAPVPTPQNVRRTIVFIVDNLSMDFTQVHRSRMALRRFVEAQMQDGDLIAVVPTAGANATFQTFSTDRRQLLAMIDSVRWYIDLRVAPQVTSQMMAMAYSIRTLRDMPGRKSLIIVSPSTMLPSPLITQIGVWLNNAKRAAEFTEASFNPLADAALRAGVVIHTLDIRGLSVPSSIDAGQGTDYSLFIPGTMELDVGKVQEKETREVAVRDTETPIPLSKKTGGLFIRDSNWFVNGIGPVEEELKGYYMLTYTPPASTFAWTPRNMYHRIRIRVKRPGAEVHARDGFYGVPQPEDASSPISKSLYAAIFSPFQYSDLKVNLASGYIEDQGKGYLLQTSLHLDARDVGLTDGKDGKNLISIEAASVTSDIQNAIRDSSAKRYEFEIQEENIPWWREHGIRFSLRLPVKKPGSYYVRTAVRDPVTGKMGSAYQYIEIPDLRKNRLSLSNIFVFNRGEDLPWAASQTPEEFRQALYPDVRRDPRKSPALRTYAPGEAVECAAIIYNAKSKKKQKPDLESRFFLFRNGQEIFRSESAAVDLENVTDFKRIPIRIRLRLKDSIPPGDYVLLLQVTDKLADKKHNLASQTLDFRALEQPADRALQTAE